MVHMFSVVRRQAFAVMMVVGILASVVASGEAPFWPQFHGPNRDNISDEEGLLDSWPEGGPELLWSAKGLGFGYSSLAIADGRIFSAGNIGAETVVTALDLSGKILWQVNNGEAWTSKPAYPGTRGTPTVDGDRVYHESPHGNVICLDAETGDTVWEVNVLKKYEAKNIRWALSASLLVDDKNVISCPGGPKASMVALDKRTGAVAWTAPSTNELAGYSSPLLFEHGGLRIVTTLTSKSLIGVNADNGKLLWRVDHESYTDQNTLMPIFLDGHLFVSTIRGGSVKWKVDVNSDEVSLAEIWRTDQFDNHHGGVVMANGNIYGTSTMRNRNKWVCLDWKTGEIEHLDTPVGKGSVTYADGMLYMLSENSEMGLVRPTDTGYDLISSFTIPEGGEGNSWAHPVVTGGRLFIRHETFLYAYDIQE